MQTERLPSEEEMGQLKRELNFLLWTDDVPEVPAGATMVGAPGARIEKGKVNIQCTAHALITSGFFMRRGFPVTTRGGMAVVIESSADGNQRSHTLDQIARHWWLTVDELGLVDLSLHGEAEHPLVYCNRSPGGRWEVAFGEERRKLDVFLAARRQGCFYLTAAKKRATEAEVKDGLAQSFPPADRSGIRLCYGAVLKHCEGLLTGAVETLTKLPQREAWARLVR